ncbi:hypothetical protein [Coraliomargarita parva]|uniref:hypothetical protein n=1 Tax=Coraliomargarita parva TaxID=3014050 RepID=UPI0022B44CF3|nr:hypothetical protein [Coraliomargarita parva]
MASGAVLLLELDSVFDSDKVVLAGETPWLRVQAMDVVEVETDTVELLFHATGLTGNEFISEWYLNLNPDLDPTALEFDLVESSFFAPEALSPVGVSTGYSTLKANGNGYFDIEFSFETAATDARFMNGDYIVYEVSLPGGSLSAADFDFYSTQSMGSDANIGAMTNPQGTVIKEFFATGAHVQSVASGEMITSTWVGDADGTIVLTEPYLIPEVSQVWFVGLVGGLALILKCRAVRHARSAWR